MHYVHFVACGSIYLPDIRLTPSDWIMAVLTFFIAVAACAQAFIAYRMWRPRAEIFLDLVDLKQPDVTPFELNIQISNLSNIGIWVEAIELIVEDVTEQLVGKLASEPERTVVPPYTAVTRIFHEPVVRAYPEEKMMTAFGKAVVRVRAVYRAHGSLHRTKWHSCSMELSMFSIRNLETL